jgi:DNA-binding response OmpR family regulator
MKERQREESLWVVSDDEELCARIQVALKDESPSVRIIRRKQLKGTQFWRTSTVKPGVVLLDVGTDLDWGVGVLRDIKYAHLRAPLVVVTCEPTHEFGMKIVSAGINYFLPREFDGQELRDVVAGLIKP